MNNNTFSFQRIGLMLKADWMTYRKRFCIVFGVIFIIFIWLVWKTMNSTEGLQSLFLLGLLICAIIYYNNYLERKVHHFPEQFLTLPASSYEKFFEIILVGLIHFVTFCALYFLALVINRLFFGIQPITFNQLMDADVRGISGALFFVASWLFLFYILFKRYGLWIGGSILIVTLVSIGKLCRFLVNSSILKTETLISWRDYSTLIVTIASVIILYISYLKLKNKQLK
jgi:hypothetical protein